MNANRPIELAFAVIEAPLVGGGTCYRLKTENARTALHGTFKLLYLHTAVVHD